MRQTIYMECREQEVKNGKTITHDKFYQLSDNGDGTLTAWFGKIGTEGRKIIKPISDWSDLERKRRDHNYKVVAGFTPTNSKHDTIRTKQLAKVRLVSNLIRQDIKNVFKDAFFTQHKIAIRDITTKLEDGGLLTADEMIYLNEIYIKLNEEK